MKRLLMAILLCSALLAASCGSDDTSGDEASPGDDTTDTSADGAGETDVAASDDSTPDPANEDEGEDDADPEPEVELTASDRGITAETITLGVAITDVEVFAPIGDMVEVYEALATLQNEAGGVGGRMIELETQKWNIGDRVAYDAACVALTQDTETFLILGFLIPDFSGSECYAVLNERIVINTEAIAEPVLADADGRAMTVAANTTDLIINGISLLAEELEGANVAVYTGNGEGLDDAVAAAEAVGAVVVDTTTQATGGAEDLLAAEAELDVAVQRWVTADVEWVISTDGSAAGSIAALQRAGRNDIGIVTLTTTATLTALGADLSVSENLIGLGAPLADEQFVDGLYGIPDCIERVSTQLGVDIVPFVPEGEEARLAVVVRACAAWDVFVTFAEEAGPDLTEESFLQAGADLGEFEMTGAPSASYGPDKAYLGNIDAAAFVFDDAAGLFVPR